MSEAPTTQQQEVAQPQGGGSVGFTREQIDSWNSAEIAAGRMSADQAAAVLRECGFAPAPASPTARAAQPDPTPTDMDPGIAQEIALAVHQGRMTQAEADAFTGAATAQPTQEQQEIAAYLTAEGFEPAKPTEFDIPPLLGPNDKPDAAYQKVDRTIRGWLSDAYLPREIGSHIAREVEKVGLSQMNASDADREVYKAAQLAQLERLFGDKTSERIDLARQLVRELEAKRPGLEQFLNSTGAGNSATIIAQLALHAERLNARRDGRK